MRRRIAPGFLAALFVLAQTSGAAGARPCPHHDGPGATGAAVAAPDAEREAAHHHDGADPRHAAPAVPHTPDAQHAAAADAPDHAHDGCACLGECSTAPAVALPGAPEARAAADPPRPPFQGESRLSPVAHTPYLIPFAHAPPLSV